jgi:DNA excision repair protein ERCC-4
MKLAVWSPRGSEQVRVYLNEHPWGDVKVWAQEAPNDTTRIVCSDRRLWGPVQAGVTAFLSDLFGGEDPTWSELLKKARGDHQRSFGAPRVARYSAVDTASLDPNTMTHPLPEGTRILVDHREPDSIAQALARVHNLQVEVCALEVGDYVVPNRDGEPVLIIERKTVNDLCTSITEDAKRLFFQTNELKAAGARGVLLIEGDLWSATRLSLPSITGTLSYLVTMQGIAPFPTIDENHTVYSVVKLARHALYGLGYDLGLRASGPRDVREAACYVLQGVPGISATRARALLDCFGSVRGVAHASRADLTRVPGVGKKTAEQIFLTLNGSAPSDIGTGIELHA